MVGRLLVVSNVGHRSEVYNKDAEIDRLRQALLRIERLGWQECECEQCKLLRKIAYEVLTR